MIRAAARGDHLIQRLRARAARVAAARRADQLRSQRSDWHSAASLWPDLFGDTRDGE